MPLLYWSHDNGQLYKPESIDLNEQGKAEGFNCFEVPEIVTLTPSDLTVQDGDILEALLRTEQATLVKDKSDWQD